MEKEKKMTKNEKFARLIAIVEGAEVEDAEMLVEFLNHEIELNSKKRSGMTKTQKENIELMEVIFNALGTEGLTVSEIFDKVRADERITSSQKVSALVKKLVDAGRAVRTQDGKKVIFTIAE